MKELKFIFKTEKKKILEKLSYYGIKELPYLLVYSGKEKIRGYSGNLSTEEIIKLNQEIGIDLMGMYLFHDYYGDENLRLSFDAISALKDQITKNIIELNEKQESEFIKGNDILLTKEDEEFFIKNNETKGFKIIKSKSANNNEFIGTGKLAEGRIINYMPKERRLR